MTAEGTVSDVISSRARWATVLGDCRDGLRSMPDGCAQTCVTSPPYFGLRDYGCDGQIGLEPSPSEYVSAMVDVMREVRRVLRDDGTLWLNVGDSYAADRGGTAMPAETIAGGKRGHGDASARRGRGSTHPHRNARAIGKKHKDLIGIPWRLAFALQDDGWYLRSDIIWSKPNPMPESVTDRPTRAHEYVFLLTKRARYFYDAGAIREQGTNRHPGNATHKQTALGGTKTGLCLIGASETRNARDVWTITPEPFAEAHFATMPPELARRCVRAGSRRSDVVLDPFMGAHTTAIIALQEGRRSLGCELNPDYLAIGQRRLADFNADTTSSIAIASEDNGPLFARRA